MENISLVSWNDLYVVDESLATELGHLVDAVNIHEMAHSYFGDAIVIRDYAHAWLKESWATYIEQVWWEETDGADEAMYDYFVNATAYFKEADSAYMRPIVTREFSSSWDMYDRHLYPGGACRLHTLRHELGDATFWEGVRLYVDRFLGRTVETDDFRRAMEEVSGRSLVLFFEQWLYGKGYPALKVTFKHDAKKQEGRFEIEQTQVDEEKEVPSFRLDLDLGWVIDGEMRVETVEIREAKHTFLVSMEHAPDQVRVDPGHKVLHKLDFNPGDEMLRRQLTEAADVIGRILAGRELAKTGRHKNLEAVAAAYRQEPFYGVRIQHALSLAGADSSLAAEALASIVREETNPRVMAWLFQAAGSVRHGSIRDALRERIEAGLPYYAARMALEALGAQRAAAPLDVLAAAADTPGYGGLAQSGAFLGLAQSRHDEAIPILLEKAAYGAASNRARPSAALALGSIGHVQVRRRREQITDALEDLLKDPHPRVRVAAVAGLRSLAEPGAIASLESYARPLPAQEQIGVQRAIRKIRAAQESPGKEVETELEALRGDLKDLTGVVESLRARIDKQDGGKGRKGRSGGKRKSRKGKP
jgi:aminopeptidase N